MRGITTGFRTSVIVSWMLLLNMLGGPACRAIDMDADEEQERQHEEQERQRQEDELAQIIEDGLAQYGEQPFFMQEELELIAAKLERRQYGERVREAARSATAPPAALLRFFAIEGVEDLILSITPFDEINKVRKLIGRGRRARRNAKKLAEFKKDLSQLMGDDIDELALIASKLGKRKIRALKTIRDKTKSVEVTRKLMKLHAKGHADVEWIADKLKAGKLDPTFARRLTFDGDLVAEYTLHAAHPSWKTLQQIVEGTGRVTQKARSSLASKVVGLMGERAAADQFRKPVFYRKYFPDNRVPPTLDRGLRYGQNQSIDIMACGKSAQAVFVEVKNWKASLWTSRAERRKIVEQLEHHNEGIEQILGGLPTRYAVKDKLLMVKKEGFEALKQDDANEFKGEIKALGWTLELIPESDIADFGDLIRSVQ